jgi:hypothetical protein
VVEVIQGCFALKCKFMERVEYIEGECCTRPADCGRKPTGAQYLCPRMDESVGTTTTKINRHVVDTRCIDNDKTLRSSFGERAHCAAMTELDLKAQLLKGSLVEKETVPNLGLVSFYRYRRRQSSIPQCDEGEGFDEPPKHKYGIEVGNHGSNPCTSQFPRPLRIQSKHRSRGSRHGHCAEAVHPSSCPGRAATPSISTVQEVNKKFNHLEAVTCTAVVFFRIRFAFGNETVALGVALEIRLSCVSRVASSKKGSAVVSLASLRTWLSVGV